MEKFSDRNIYALRDRLAAKDAEIARLREALNWAIGQMELDGFEPLHDTVKQAWDNAHTVLAEKGGL